MTTIATVRVLHANPLTEPIAVPSAAPTAEDWQREEDKVFIGCARSAAMFVLIGALFVGLFNFDLNFFPVGYGLIISVVSALVGLIATVRANTNEKITKRGIFCYAAAIVGVFAAMPAIYQVILELAAR
ncbi:MAG TPA: hypothetical protein VM581_02570 [Magnetospirillaceae bacterium]|nr:hypothetical protein [Magnetospirillaceae bacterium]